jgi:hypothetical protein
MFLQEVRGLRKYRDEGLFLYACCAPGVSQPFQSVKTPLEGGEGFL